MKNRLEGKSIRYSIFSYFTVTALVMGILIALFLNTRFSSQLSASMETESENLVSQVSGSVESFLRTIMKLSDSIYYGVIKNADLSQESINRELQLLYDNNKDNVENIAVFDRNGQMLEVVPAARMKSHMDISQESWFAETLAQPENLHFSTPHVQYLFDGSENQYKWVISVSRAVEITDGPFTTQGVLLIDIRYSSLDQIVGEVSLGDQGYLYLMDRNGEIICHPKAQLINAGLVEEDNEKVAGLREGSYREKFAGEERITTVKSIGYTGWKAVGVNPVGGMNLNILKTRIFVVFIVLLFLFVLTLINAYISSRITNPIKELEKSVSLLESGDLDAPVYIGGSAEIRSLGRSIQGMAMRIKGLMNDIVTEHESKRKSEFDTLQSQINPHFLYNTLDIIVWMIENEKKTDAVRVVTALARFFRISLSRGKSIITVKDELEHVRNYLMIQQMRFKNKFTYEIDADEDTLELASLKLMLQPMVENAIYHGMEFMDGDGVVQIRAWREAEDLYLRVRDNGLGMTEEQVENLFRDSGHVPSKGGSGIGVRNVNERIQLYFGEGYGLRIESEPDEGTDVIIHLPAVPYSEILEREGK
ncbi:MAG TPA: sensor histidine kinase [Candidatus Lachnoclostridium stercorigallinarum]|uniref:histidine kinase n=1 Tax=Candidatus Lachnoclostridium stercorigallinarum TaxID=2838634 RepID=A0A9D2K665_9FIRM|nr:sensor histidine kinase [Candidatus Lachnoclostridium stercorigallinarum]